MARAHGLAGAWCRRVAPEEPAWTRRVEADDGKLDDGLQRDAPQDERQRDHDQQAARFDQRVGDYVQITDDIIDARDKTESVSFPAVFGADRSQQMAQEATVEALAALGNFDERAAPLRQLAVSLLERQQ